MFFKKKDYSNYDFKYIKLLGEFCEQFSDEPFAQSSINNAKLVKSVKITNKKLLLAFIASEITAAGHYHFRKWGGPLDIFTNEEYYSKRAKAVNAEKVYFKGTEKVPLYRYQEEEFAKNYLDRLNKETRHGIEGDDLYNRLRLFDFEYLAATSRVNDFDMFEHIYFYHHHDADERVEKFGRELWAMHVIIAQEIAEKISEYTYEEVWDKLQDIKKDYNRKRFAAVGSLPEERDPRILEIIRKHCDGNDFHKGSSIKDAKKFDLKTW